MTNPATPDATVAGSDASAVDALDQAIEDLTGAAQLLVALDFDGTLAPFADNPEDVGALPGSWAAILTLDRAKHTQIALVSGRSLDNLAAVAHAPESVALVGSHGAEWRVDGRASGALTAEERDRVERVGAVLDEVGARHPGVAIEHKPAGHGVHTRLVSSEEATDTERDALASVQKVDADVHIRRGKNILEFSIRHVTKGDAISMLRESFGADRVFFAGDDTTDEDGFLALDQDAGDVGVKVGDGETAARYRVSDPSALTDVLKRLARARAVR
jgi:trehalose 6-phosphate phosphatase